jgi:hypothetical protein
MLTFDQIKKKRIVQSIINVFGKKIFLERQKSFDYRDYALFSMISINLDLIRKLSRKKIYLLKESLSCKYSILEN